MRREGAHHDCPVLYETPVHIVQWKRLRQKIAPLHCTAKQKTNWAHPLKYLPVSAELIRSAVFYCPETLVHQSKEC